MSERHGNGNAQWTKTSTQKQQNPVTNQIFDLPTTSTILTQPNILYGSSGGGGGGGDIPSAHLYGTARFQPPPIHHVTSSTSVPTVLSSLGVTTPIASSNVPAPSGFVPPPFPPIAAATSVLTPNPFAIPPNSNLGSHHSHFSLEQFQHLNPQQQVELSKIMSAMNTAASNTIGNTPAGLAVSPIPLATNSGLTGNVPQLHTQTSQSKTPTFSQAHSHAARHTVNTPSGSGGNNGIINNSIAESVRNAIGVASHSSSGNPTTPTSGRISGIGIKVPPDAEKMRRIQQVVESGIGEHAKEQILQILEHISTLKPAEKLLLYLRLPGDGPETDPLRHPQNPLGTRSEINHTINWVRTHLEQDSQVSIPKQDVYTDYITYCERLDIKPLSTADFGKVMKQVFPGIRPRRLGTRGHSRYCYAAMRKTTKLTVPQLPQLKPSTSIDTEKSSDSDLYGFDDESWEVIKNWAENILHAKVDNVKDLVTRIKNNNNSGIPISTNVRPNVHQKKYAPREPKEKRPSSDTGPLKKRRKKKRKGSSSPESVCNQSLQSEHSDDKHTNPNAAATTIQEFKSSLSDASQDEQNLLKFIKVKEEIVEPPNVQHLNSATGMHLMTKLDGNNSVSYLQNQAHQMLPMNLATEQRAVLTKSQITNNSFQPVNELRHSFGSAAKNLTPKIMELAAAERAARDTGSIQMSSDQPSIKEENTDEYNHANIFCKKVRKAQQTKGFWNNSPTPTPNNNNTNNNNNHSSQTIPTITTTNTAQVTHSNTSSVICTTSSVQNMASSTAVGGELGMESTVTNYLMGPPVNTGASVSPSSNLLDATAATPKVASRNMLQLRAKKQQQHLAEAAAEMSVDKDADLPENFGIPRERVISICNMDKHELDDYLMPGEEENSQDQDTELLQYFQTGDAEEKVNSLDAAKNRIPTATTQIALAADKMNQGAANDISHNGGMRNDLNENSCKSSSAGNRPTSAIAAVPLTNNGLDTSTPVACNNNISGITAQSEVMSPAVGSASASLALMSQKHQQHQKLNNIGIKRKINLHPDGYDVPTARKNFIFLPISPNTSTSGTTTDGTYSASGNAVSCFASPGLKRLRPKPSFSKQQSLDSESNDPMIGASYRRRAYGSSMPVNTSASAPPSPSVLQQQQQLFGSASQFLNHQWQVSTPNCSDFNDGTLNSNALLTEQNSLDLDLFSASSATETNNQSLPQPQAHGLPPSNVTNMMGNCQLTPLNEMQRSQSVPLSQLQRIHSPTFSRASHANFSACTSVTQTPIPPEFVDSTTIFSENSCSQHSASGGGNSGGNNRHNTPSSVSLIKLEEEVALAPHASTIFDEVDVSDILSPDFVSSIAQINTPATTCSSAGSSSGYSSVGPSMTFGTLGNGNSGIVSRSVPSTPLPHQQNIYCHRRRYLNDEPLSPTSISPNMSTSAFTSTAFKYGGSSHASRSVYDISKSMPTTPITTPCFRYSPSEFSRDFLINGNTIDSIASFGGGMGNDSLLCGTSAGAGGGGDSMDMGIASLNADTLIDDSRAPTEAFDSVAVMPNDAESIMVGADILGGL